MKSGVAGGLLPLILKLTQLLGRCLYFSKGNLKAVQTLFLQHHSPHTATLIIRNSEL